MDNSLNLNQDIDSIVDYFSTELFTKLERKYENLKRELDELATDAEFYPTPYVEKVSREVYEDYHDLYNNRDFYIEECLVYLRNSLLNNEIETDEELKNYYYYLMNNYKNPMYYSELINI